MRLSFKAEAEKLSAMANEQWSSMGDSWWLDEKVCGELLSGGVPGDGFAFDCGGGVAVWLVVGSGVYTVHGFCRGETRDRDRLPGIASRAPAGSEWLAFFAVNGRKGKSRVNPAVEANSAVAVLVDGAWCLGIVKGVRSDGLMAKVLLGDGALYEHWQSYFAWDDRRGFDSLWNQGRTRFGHFGGMAAAEKAARKAAGKS